MEPEPVLVPVPVTCNHKRKTCTYEDSDSYFDGTTDINTVGTLKGASKGKAKAIGLPEDPVEGPAPKVRYFILLYSLLTRTSSALLGRTGRL